MRGLPGAGRVGDGKALPFGDSRHQKRALGDGDIWGESLGEEAPQADIPRRAGPPQAGPSVRTKTRRKKVSVG